MQRDTTSNWSLSLLSKSSLAIAFRGAVSCVPQFVLAVLSVIGANTLPWSTLYADDLPKHAQTPDDGVPPSPVGDRESATELDIASLDTASALRPYTNPGNLRFRPSPMRSLPIEQAAGDDKDSEQLSPRTPAPESALRVAAAGDEKQWQVQHDNPLRKGSPPKKGFVTPPLSPPSLTQPAGPEVPAPQPEDKPIKDDASSEKLLTLEQAAETESTEASTKEPFQDMELVVPSRSTQEKEETTTPEMAPVEGGEETVLHLGDDQEASDDQDKPAPLPPGIQHQPIHKAKPQKGFDPEDNDQPAQSGQSLSEGAAEEDPQPQDIGDEAPSSELLKALQENSALDAPNSTKSKAGSLPSETTPKANSKTPSGSKPSAMDSKPVVVPPAKQPIKVLPQTARLRPRIDASLNYYLFRPESNVERSPWAVFHAILPFGSETTIKANGRTVSAINWMCYNGSCRGQRIFIPQKNGTFQPAVGAGVQGHEGQFLAILAQSRVPANYPLQIAGKRYTVEDLIDYEMRTCKAKTELTFKLIALSHYLVNDATWVNDQGEEWSLERLVEEELAQPIIGAACGGTHRLMGLSFALKQRKAAGLPIDGQYARAEVFLKDFVDYAWTLQNPDGSFSTEWFEGRGNKQDMQRKLQTTGHIVEWLVFTLPDEELQSPRLLRSIEFLTYCLVEQRQTDWKIGPRSHALHALAMYQERLFGVTMGTRRNLATASSRNQRR